MVSPSKRYINKEDFDRTNLFSTKYVPNNGNLVFELEKIYIEPEKAEKFELTALPDFKNYVTLNKAKDISKSTIDVFSDYVIWQAMSKANFVPVFIFKEKDGKYTTVQRYIPKAPFIEFLLSTMDSKRRGTVDTSKRYPAKAFILKEQKKGPVAVEQPVSETPHPLATKNVASDVIRYSGKETNEAVHSNGVRDGAMQAFGIMNGTVIDLRVDLSDLSKAQRKLYFDGYLESLLTVYK